MRRNIGFDKESQFAMPHGTPLTRTNVQTTNPKCTMTEDPGNLKPQRPNHLLARAIGVLLVILTGFAVYKLIGIDTNSFWPFLVLVVVGSFIGNVIGVFLAQKIASK